MTYRWPKVDTWNLPVTQGYALQELSEIIALEKCTIMEAITGAIQLLPRNDRNAYHKYSDEQLRAALAKYIRMKKANRDHFETVQKLSN